MEYIGEHLLPGQLGHFFVILSLVASLVATFAYFRSTQSKNIADAGYWKKLARYSFFIEVLSVFAIFGILVYIVSNHLFEYKYAWQHSSRSLELKYLLASLWEGQEGSFLLWSVWHCVLGLVLIFTAKKWEAPVMTVVSFAQFCLATMIIGIYIFEAKIGSNPFILLRDSDFLDNAPALHIGFDVNQPLRPDYMLSITDGNDLNPLLQNYWMVIHPPVLFLGFASTLIPFAFAIAGLWTKNFSEWTKAALPWALFSAAFLVTGIMMGAMWAYESLTFGGYWAWDPVENASLVPWLILIGGIHTLLIYRHSGHALRSTHLFFILCFFLILYSTFLTRSGILGDSSVHAFTDLGMNIQLYLFLTFFIWLGAIISAKNLNQRIKIVTTGLVLLFATHFLSTYNTALFSKPVAPILAFLTPIAGIIVLIYLIQSQVPGVQKEENTSSREFWMFIGALIFFLSAILIISITSLPVFNAVFDLKKAEGENQERLYNRIHVFIAIIITVLTAVIQYLRYNNTPSNIFWKKIWLPTLLGVILATLTLIFINIDHHKEGPGFLAAIWIAVACSVYTIVANASYIWIGLKGKLKLSGGSVAHVGFGMILLGILISASKKEILSYNTSGIFTPLEENKLTGKPGENLTLVKGVRTDMGKYWVTYLSEEKHPKKEQWYYNILFEKKDGTEKFTLRPNAFVNYKGNESLMANPSSRHYLDHDVFTYITALPDPTKIKDTANFTNKVMSLNDTLFYSKGFFVLERLISKDNIPTGGFEPDDIATVATVKVYSGNGTTYKSELLFINKKGNTFSYPDTVTSESLIFRINHPIDDNKVELGIKESDAVMEYLTLKAYMFPFINLLWAGVVIMVVGMIMSMVRRISLNRKSAAEA